MKKTKHFNTLSEKTKKIIQKYAEIEVIYEDKFTRLDIEESRARIYEINGSDIILKEFLEKGKDDQDICALNDLDGVKYFPKLYAYKEYEYLFMEKAPGIDLETLRKNKINKTESTEIEQLIIDAHSMMLDRCRIDYDFNLRHIFWCKKNKKLTWIDLGSCSKYSHSTHGDKEIEIEAFKEILKNKLLYGI